jgi:ParB-like chromosome segregation protein Spo0J
MTDPLPSDKSVSHAKRGQRSPNAIHLEPLDRLKPAKVNPRTHSAEQVRQLADAILEYGWTLPILYDYGVDETVAGHGRQMAAALIYDETGIIHLAPGAKGGGKPLPKGTVPVLDVTGWEPEQRRAYLLADNALAEQAGWDWAVLGSELRDLEGLGFDLDLTGFTNDQLDDVFARITEPEADPDVVPEPPRAAVTKLGDLWKLGDHLLLCGDATHAEEVKRVGGSEAMLLLTDPPYGIGFDYESHDDSDNVLNSILVGQAFELGPDGKVWTPGLNNLFRDGQRFGEAKVAIWHKGFAAAGSGLGGASTFEPILVIDPPRRDLPNNYIRVGVDRAEVDGRNLGDLHPCPKPVELYERLARAFSHRGDAIYEPFCGSGTTLIACERTGRHCRAIEIDPVYCDVVIMRWQQLTGASATLDGATFEDIKSERLAAEPIEA